jgi:5-methylcytosine-specific restriction endonuclease McrA
MSNIMRADAKFCSEDCNSAAHAVTRKMAKRASRPRKPGSPLFARDELARRDGYVCGLCCLPVDMALVYPDPGFGSIDHVVPVARGGSNDLSNLQLAHLSCNLRKGDRVDLI